MEPTGNWDVGGDGAYEKVIPCVTRGRTRVDGAQLAEDEVLFEPQHLEHVGGDVEVPEEAQAQLGEIELHKPVMVDRDVLEVGDLLADAALLQEVVTDV